MKLKLTLIIIALGCLSSVHAHIIDITPGGFTSWQDPRVQDWLLHQWNHQGGQLIGQNHVAFPGDHWEAGLVGEPYFSASQLGLSSITFTWDLTTLDDYRVRWVMVQSEDALNLYQVTGATGLEGSFTFTGDGTSPILGFALYGTNSFHTPDYGQTSILFGMALLGLIERACARVPIFRKGSAR